MKRDIYLDLINAAFKEDLGETGDVTSEAIFDTEITTYTLVSKDTGVLAGITLFKDVFLARDESILVELFRQDGDLLSPGDKIARISGPVVPVLCAERVAINFLSFLSGIATRTSQFVKAASAGGGAVILDTRKTIPAYRELSKYAVRVGGGKNHRMGLHDMVMIKDNHIDAAGGITPAVQKVRKMWGDRFRIEVECRTLEEVKEAADLKVQVIMLDNMNLDQMREAVLLVKGSVELEASGNMSLERIREVSAAGVDYISVGMITKSVEAFDFSLRKE